MTRLMGRIWYDYSFITLKKSLLLRTVGSATFPALLVKEAVFHGLKMMTLEMMKLNWEGIAYRLSPIIFLITFAQMYARQN